MTSFTLLLRCFLYTFVIVGRKRFRAFLYLWNLFLKKIEKFKIDLMTSFILLLRIWIKNGFYNFYKRIPTKYYLQNEHSQDFINAPTFLTKLLWTRPGHPKFEAFLSQIENPKKCLKTEKMLLRKRIEGYVLLFRTKIITC